ncbi:hypothetical protein CK203_105884 [Vitis vinifera]|uniref:Uncharacterized protein n=1 Tax=Vitis vinifera TaxID=29760 RepID=A0A438EI63_VITVI|nr:hypothetical protein CK203_105884 [Vitis vinifera]
MESVIGYRFGTLPHQSIHMSSGYNAAITTKPYCFSHFSTKPHLSFSQNSSFSLHKSSRGHPLEHILGPITFTVGYPSTSLTGQKSRLPQAFTAEHFLEVLFPAQFNFFQKSRQIKLGSVLSLTCMIVQPGKGSSSPTPELDTFKQNQLNLESTLFHTVVNLAQVVAVAKELKSSGHKDIAEKLMTIHEPQIDTPGEPADRHCKEKMKILEILIAEGMFPEASKYSADIDSHMSSYEPHLDSDVFKNLKFVIFCGLDDHSEANKLRKKLEKPPVGPKKIWGRSHQLPRKKTHHLSPKKINLGQVPPVARQG